MTRIELAGLMLGLLAVSVAGGISWRLFRPHRGAHVYDLAPVPIPRLEYGSMILEEETRLRGDWQDAYVRELAPETLDEEASYEPARADLAGAMDDRAGRPPAGMGDYRASDTGYEAEDPARRNDRLDSWPGPGELAAVAGDQTGPADIISMMSDEDFFHMARFEFRRLEWMASEPLTLPAWTGRAA